jgi:hypothetical protein
MERVDLLLRSSRRLPKVGIVSHFAPGPICVLIHQRRLRPCSASGDICGLRAWRNHAGRIYGGRQPIKGPSTIKCESIVLSTSEPLSRALEYKAGGGPRRTRTINLGDTSARRPLSLTHEAVKCRKCDASRQTHHYM